MSTADEGMPVTEYGARVRALRKKSVDEIVEDLEQLPKPASQEPLKAEISRRIAKELDNLREDTFADEYAWPLPGHDSRYLLAVVQGPADTPYEGGIFWVELMYTLAYPSQPPKIRLVTKIYHPNIMENGTIVAEPLFNQWSPVFYLGKLLVWLGSLLGNPVIEDPLVPDVGQVYQDDYGQYYRTAKDWTATHAQSEQVKLSDLKYAGTSG